MTWTTIPPRQRATIPVVRLQAIKGEPRMLTFNRFALDLFNSDHLALLRNGTRYGLQTVAADHPSARKVSSAHISVGKEFGDVEHGTRYHPRRNGDGVFVLEPLNDAGEVTASEVTA